MSRTRRAVKTWPLVAIGLFLLAGFVYWDYTRHRQVEKYVEMSPEIPGAEVTGDSPVELARFHEIRSTMTRRIVQGDVRITAVWNTPEFFRALANAEGAQARDIRRHETLYHAYGKKFNFHSDFIFTLVLDSASLDLRPYPVKETSVLRNDKGVEVIPWRWLEARSSSQHREGILFFPQRTQAGQPMIGHVVGEHLPGESPPVWIELTLKGLPGGQEAVLHWDLSQHP